MKLILTLSLLLLSAVAFAGEATLTWQHPQPGMSFNLYRGVGAACHDAQPLPALHATTKNLLYQDLNLGGGLTYCYEVTAFNVGGESARTNRVSKAIPAPPAPPVAVESSFILGFPSSNHVTLECPTGTGIKTTGSGLKRTVECLH